MKTVKNTFVTFFSLFLIFISVLSTISCEIGLGASVDTEPPKFEIAYPPIDSVIRGNFAIGGTWSDDGVIAGVTVSIKKTDSTTDEVHELTGSLVTNKDSNDGTWRVIVEPKAEDGTINFTDGSYQATVVIKDSVDRATTQITTFAIDNTAPVIVLTRPSTAADTESSSFDTYGQTFNLEGQAADTNNVSLIEVKIYTDPECTEESYVYTKNLYNVPNSINMDVAKFEKGNTENDYYQIYKDSTTDGGAKNFYCRIIAYDGAQRFPIDGEQTAEDTKGNSTEEYYLYKDIATSILQPYKITEVYSILNGTFKEGTSARSINSTDVLSLLNKSKRTTGRFTLNPKNNPTFTVTGQSPLVKDESGKYIFNNNTLSNGSQTVVEVSPGLDGILLDEASLKVYAIRYENGATTGDRIYPDTEKQESGTSYKFITTITRDKGFEIGKTYLFGVEGYDQSDAKNPIEPAAEAYGFYMASSGKAPQITITSPADTNTYINKNELTFTGTVEVELGKPDIDVYVDDEVSPIYTITGNEINLESKTADEEKYSFSWTYQNFGTTSTTKKISFVAKLGGQKSQKIEKNVVYDVDLPTIAITPPSTAKKFDAAGLEDTSAKYLNGSVDFTVMLNDKGGSGLNTSTEGKQPKWEILDATNLSVISSGIITETTGQTIPVNTADEKYNGKKIIFRVTVYDNAGNTASSLNADYSYKVDQSTDLPYLGRAENDETIDFGLNSKDDYSAQLGEKKNTVQKGATLRFRVYDDDGTANITILNKRIIDTEWVPLANLTNVVQSLSQDTPNKLVTVSSYTFPSNDADCGYYEYAIIASDTADSSKKTVLGPFVIRITQDKASITVEPNEQFANDSLEFSKKITVTPSEGPYTLYRQVVRKDIDAYTDSLPTAENPSTTDIGHYKEIASLTDTNLVYNDENLTIGSYFTDGNTKGDITIYYKVLDGSGQASEQKAVDIKYDTNAPTVTLTAPIGVKTGSKAITEEKTQFSVKAIDGTAESGVAKIYYKFDHVETASSSDSGFTPDNTSNGTYVIDVEFIEASQTPVTNDESIQLQEDKWYFHAYAEDAAGNKTEVLNYEFDADRKLPTLTPAIDGIPNSNVLKYFKGNLTGTVTASDTKALDETNGITFTLDGTPVTATVENGHWTIAEDLFTEGTQQSLVITATDWVGRKTSSNTFTVYNDKIGPQFSVVNPGTVEESTKTITGSVNDGSGSGAVSVEWFNGSTYEAVSSFTEGTTNWNHELTLGSVEGSKTYTFKAKDDLGNESTQAITFEYDINRPEIRSTDTYSTDSVNYVDANKFTLTGKAWDSNKLSRIEVKSNGEPVSSGITLPADLDGKTSESTAAEWSCTLGTDTTAVAEGSYTVKVTAYDVAEKASATSVEKTIVIDRTPPEVKITTPANDYYTNGTAYTFKGTVKDTNLKTVNATLIKIENNSEVEVKTEEIFPVNNSWTWTVTALSDANYKVKITAEDEVNHTTSETSEKKLIVDTQKPVISIISDGNIFDMNGNVVEDDTAMSSSATYYAKSAFTLKGNISEVNFKEASLKKGQGEGASALTFKTGGTSSGAWSYAQTKSDGTYVYTLSVSDKANNSDSTSVTVIIDTTAPSKNDIDSPVTGRIKDNSLTDTNYIFKGTANDNDGNDNNGTGVAKLWYKFSDSSTAPSDISDYDSMDASDGSWTIPKLINSGRTPEESGNLYEGKWYLHVKVQDKAGNITDATSREFDIDFASPEITTYLETTKITSDSEQIKTGDFTLSFELNESNGLDATNPVTLSVKKVSDTTKKLTLGTDYTVTPEDESAITDLSKVTTGKKYTIAISSPVDALYTYEIKAKDLVGKETSLTRKVRRDTKPPVITVTSPNDFTKWQSTSSLTILGTASDDSGTAAVYYALNPEPVPEIPATETLNESKWTGWTQAKGTSSWNISLANVPSKADNKLYLAAVDVNGRTSASAEVKTLKVDASEPELEALYYKLEGGTLQEASGIAFVNGAKKVTVYGRYSEDRSKVCLNELNFNISGTELTPVPNTLKFSTQTINATEANPLSKQIEGLSYEAATENKEEAAVYWTATFSEDILAGNLNATGKNGAGGIKSTNLFTIKRDTKPPVISDVKPTTTLADYKVVTTKEENKYFINNTKGKFNFAITADDVAGSGEQVSGIKEVKLTIDGLTTQPPAQTSLTFTNIDLSGITTASTTAKITVTDKADNVSDEYKITFVFDTVGPNGVHKFDDYGKDLYFRFGEYDNDTVDNEKDKNVGGKYSPDSFSKLKTMKIRGAFKDFTTAVSNDVVIDTTKDGDGSGVSMIYYRIYDHEPSEDEINTYKTEYKSSSNSFFPPLTEPETKRVYYNNNADNDEIKSTYKTTIADLNEGQNYLVLLAIDEVGNVATESVSYNGGTYSNYKLNVDQTQPDIVWAESSTIYINGKEAYQVTGTYEDHSAWVKEMKFTYGTYSNQDVTVTPDKIEGESVKFSSVTDKTNVTELTCTDLSVEKYDYLTKEKHARIKIYKTVDEETTTSYHDVISEKAPKANSGKIRFTPAIDTTETGVTYKVEFGSGSWAAEIPSDKLKSNTGTTKTVSLTAVDNAENSKTEPIVATIVVDRDYPKVEIESLGTTINKTVPLKINASDKFSLKTIKLQYKKSTDPDTSWTVYETKTITESTPATPVSTYTWETSINTADSSKFEDGKEYNFRAIAEDFAKNEGNSGETRPSTDNSTDNRFNSNKTKTATISQDSDRPVIKFVDLTLPAEGSLVPWSSTDLSFTISDDDTSITLDKVKYQITDINAESYEEDEENNPKWINKNLTYTNGRFRLSGIEEGEQKLWFKINDGVTDFISTATESAVPSAPKICDSKEADGNVYSANTILSLKIDTQKPEIAEEQYLKIIDETNKTYTESSWKNLSAITNDVFGGDAAKESNKFRISLYAWDKNTVTKVKLLIPSNENDDDAATYEVSFAKVTEEEVTKFKRAATKKMNDNNTYDLWLSPEIDATKFATSQRTCTISVTEGVEPKSETITLNFDNEAPHLTGSISPEPNEPVVGTIKIKGEVADNDHGSGVYADGLKYYIPKSSETKASESLEWLTPTAPGSSSWKIELSNLNETIGYKNEDESVGKNYEEYGEGLDGLYRIPVWFRLEDKYGNVDYDYTKVSILYNPNADKPMVSITDPVHDAPETNPTYVIAGGKLKISGSASDNTGISTVYLQFDMDGDGTYENGSGITGAPTLSLENIPNKKENGVQLQGVKAKGTDVWSCEINIMNLAEQSTLKVRAISIDKGHDAGHDLYSAWSSVLNVHVENIKPQFTTPELRRYDNEISFTSTMTAAEKTEAADAYNTRKEYKKNMYIKESSGTTWEKWYIYGEVLVKTGNYITELSADTDADGTWRGVSGAQTTGNDSGDVITWSVDNGLTHKYLIPVKRNNKDAWATTVTAKGKNITDSKNENETTVYINIDNDAPEFSDNNSNNVDTLGNIQLYKNTYGGSVFTDSSTGRNSLQNDNSYVTMFGKVSDGGSGFKRLAFYFVRKDSSNAKRIYNIMEEYGANRTANKTSIVSAKASGSVYINGEHLPALYLAASATTRSSETTITAAAINNNKNIRVGGLIKIGGEYRTIKKVEGSTVTFDSACATTFKEVEFVYAMVVDSAKESIVGTTHEDDDGDGMFEKYTNEDISYTWQARIDSKHIPDGPIEIHCVVFDEAGNSNEGWTKTYVSNNPPRITSVMLGTDLNADNKYTLADEEKETEFKQFWFDTSDTHDKTQGTDIWNLDATINDNKYWTAKKDLVVIPEFVGGTGDIYYAYSKNTTVSEDNKLSGPESDSLTKLDTSSTDLVLPENKTLSGNYKLAANKIGIIILKNYDTANSDGPGKISTTTGDYEKDGDDGENIYSFSFWDSTEECTPGTDSQWTILNVTLKQDLADNTAPTGTIEPFYWKKENGQFTSSVVYVNDVAQGHIELEDDWIHSEYYENFDTKPTSGEYDADPKVSGKIKIEGTAFDETMLKTIKVTFDNKSVTATYHPYTYTETVINGETQEEVEIKKGWSYATNTADFTLAITDTNGPTQEGHSVTWTYTVDTSKASAVAAIDRVIKVEVTDTSSANSGAGNNNTVSEISTKASAKTSYYKVDIVPYITELTTELTKLNKKRHSVYGRTSLGKYPVYFYSKADDGTPKVEKIGVEGFNLSGGAVKLQNVTNTINLGTDNTFTIADNAKSGKIYVVVNGIKSLNNENNNDAKGSYIDVANPSSLYTNYQYYYNRQPNDENNDILTDDVEIAIWEMNARAVLSTSGTIREPVMHVNPTNGMLGFGFLSGAERASYPNGNTNSYDEWSWDWTSINSMEFIYDWQGRTFGTQGGTDTYTPSSKAARYRLVSSIWGKTSDFGTQSDANTTYSAYHALRLEYMAKPNPFVANPFRYLNPKLASAPGTSNNLTNLYHLYYDDLQSELRFRAGTINASGTTPDTTNFSKSPVKYGDFADDAWRDSSNGNNNYATVYTNSSVLANTKTTYGTGKYYDIAVVPSGANGKDVVVAVWYDTVAATLWYSYMEDPLTNNHKNVNTTTHVNTSWHKPTPILDGTAGGYCAITVDEDKHVHIASYSTENTGSLIYTYLDTYKSSYSYEKNSCTVESYGTSGEYLKLEVAKDSDGHNVPHISYYMASIRRPKYAYLVDFESSGKNGTTYAPKAGADDDDMYTGAWETIMIPVKSEMAGDGFSIGVYRYQTATDGHLKGEIREIPTRNGTVGSTSGTVGGNGTSNPVMAYGIKYLGSGYIETAQLK